LVRSRLIDSTTPARVGSACRKASTSSFSWGSLSPFTTRHTSAPSVANRT